MSVMPTRDPQLDYHPAPETPPPASPNPYEFFLNPPAPPKRRVLGSGSMAQWVAIVVGGGTVLMILLALAVSLFGGNSSQADLISVAQSQQELIRVSTLATTQVQSQTATNSAYTIQTTIGSAQAQLLAYLAAHGVKPSPQELSLAQTSTTDQSLAAAQAAGTYDSAYASIMQSQLSSYQSTLNRVYPAVSDPQAQQMLRADYNGAGLLLRQLGSH